MSPAKKAELYARNNAKRRVGPRSRKPAICRRCGTPLTAENAVADKRYSTGFDRLCKPCNRKGANAWFYANHEYATKRNGTYAKAHPGVHWAKVKADPVRHAKKLAERAAYRKANPEKVRAGLAAWYAANGKAYHEKNRTKLNAAALRHYYEKRRGTEQAREGHRKWKRENPKRWRELQRNAMNARRAQKSGRPCTLTSKQWLEILEAFDNRCAYCLRKTRLEQDHVIALARGGENTAENVVPACRGCNAKKRSKPVFAMVSASGVLRI